MKLKIIIAAAASALFLAFTAILLLWRHGADIPDHLALKSFFFEGDFDEFRAEMFGWYRTIERKDGALLINTQYYDRDILDAWSAESVYKNVPEREFLYCAASPSYLDEISVKPLDGSIDAAWDGVRLYLLPNTLDDRDIETLKAFLTEDAQKDADHGGIKNGFTERREIRFLEYAPESYYTWRSEAGQPAEDSAPVFYVCTTENMTSFESESLIATGTDSYIKFKDEDALERLKDAAFFEKYSLKFAKASDIYK